MTKILFIAVFFCSSVSSASELVSSEIKEVMVYPQGAQVLRKATIQLKAGVNSLSLTELSRYIDANSIQVKLSSAKIVSLNYRLDHLNNKENNAEKQQLKDKIAQLEHHNKSLNNEKLAAEQELKLIEQNVQIKGQAVLDVADLEDFLMFYRKNIPVIRGNLLVIEEESNKVRDEINVLKQELNSLANEAQIVRGVIDLEIGASVNSEQTLELTYFVHQAGWSPSYNVRAKSVNENLSLEFNASVYQSTGEDWKNIQLSLATGTPHLNGNAPVLYPWWANFYEPRAVSATFENKKMETDLLMEGAPAMAMDQMQFEPISITDNLTFREYKVNTPYNISSDGKQQRVEIAVFQVAASFEYYAAPKLSNEVFLLAKIPNWENYNLLSGTSKIYFEDTYVGEVYLNAKTTNDTLDLSLGQDKNIMVERKIISDQSGKNFLGSKQSKTQHVEIHLRNNKTAGVKIILLDQIPVSQNSEIKVELKESSGAKHSAETGELKWDINLAPSEKTQKTFEFEVVYPKGKMLNL